MNRLAVATGLIVVLLGSCSQNADTIAKDTWQDLQIDDLANQLTALQQSRDAETSRKAATLIPSDKGYSILDTDAGPLAVSLQRVEPYADGSRAHLRIGNLSSATITELRANVRWGPVNARSDFEGEPRSETWRELNGPFPPGRWHDETLDLAGVSPTKLGKIELSNGTVNNLNLLSE